MRTPMEPQPPEHLRSRRWRPAPLISVSVAVHSAAASLASLRPALWPWAAGAVAANHIVLAASGLWPRSGLLGPNWTRLPDTAITRGKIAITIDDGPDPEVTPTVLDILAEHRARATFFCIGKRLAARPDLARSIISRGHSIENHSQHHLHRFSVLGPRAMAREILAAQEIISTITGVCPVFFRAPAGLRNPFLDPILSRMDLKLASWTRRGFDTVTRDPGLVLDRLTAGLRSGDILLLHDGNAARSRRGAPIIVEVLPALLKRVASAGLDTIALRSAH